MSYYLIIFMFCLSASVTPGPNNIMLMTSSLNFGIKKTLPHYVGIGTGFTILFLVIGLGFGSIFMRYPIIHQIIKVVGVLYMSYLVYKICTAHRAINGQKDAKPFTFLQAVMFQWVNPKAWVMSVGAVSVFTQVNEHVISQVLILALMFVITIFPSGLLWMSFGHGLKRIMKNDKHQRLFNYCMGGLLALSILLMIFE